MKIRKGDTVKILSGKDRGKTGKVVSVNPKKDRAVVEGANVYMRHQRPKKQGEKGQRIQVPMSVNASNLMIVEGGTKKPTRVGFRKNEKGVKERISKKTSKVL